MAYGAVAASLLLIAGLWLVLLPGQLSLNGRNDQSDPLWQKLRNDGQAAIDEWHSSLGQAQGSLGDLPLEQELKSAMSEQVGVQAAEISRFSDRLNEEIIENPNPQTHVTEEEAE